MENNEELQNQNQQNVGNEETEQQGQEQGSKVTFTDEQQAAINKLIAEQTARERSKAEQRLQDYQQKAEQEKQDAIQKAQERAKMSADERAKAEQADRQKKMEAQRQELAQQLREVQTKNLLIDKGISLDMLPLLMGDNDDATQENIDQLNKFVDKKVHEATQKLLQGKQNPSNGTGAPTTPIANNPWAKQTWNLTQQQQILATNPEQAQQMIAQAQPTGFYFK